MEEKVSIIMPNYNCGNYIEETVLSVINQTYRNWELLVVDDCSTDNSVEVIRKLQEADGRIKIFINEKNSGAAASRNKALREASGKWIAFLDSDDLWTTDKLEKQIAFMTEKGCKFSYTAYEHIDENSAPMNIRVTGPGNISKRKMFHYCYLGCLTVMYDCSELGAVQIPDEIGNGENDYAIWLKVVKKHKCYYLPEVMAKYRVRANSLSHKSSKLKIAKNCYKLYKLSEEKNAVSAFFCTVRNLFYGFWKKTIYVRKVRHSD